VQADDADQDGPGAALPGALSDPDQEPEAAPVELMGKGEFFDLFKLVFATAAMIPPGLQSLPIAQGEEPSARACSDSLYDLIAPTPFRWLLETGGRWSAIVAFLAAKGFAVWCELRAIRAQQTGGGGDQARDQGGAQDVDAWADGGLGLDLANMDPKGEG
jgi:hypothetical protein